MGCCFSCTEDKSSQLGDAGERTTLLGNPVSNSAQGDEYGGRYKSMVGQKGDERSALNRILHQTASNVIDVAAMNTHIEQQEYMDRARLYLQRMTTATHRGRGKSIGRQPLILADLPAPEKLLSADPLSPSDIKMMNETCEKVRKCLQDVKVEHKEDLVVQFGIP